MYKRSKLLTEDALGLVATFERVSQQVADLDTTILMDNKWGEEDEKTTNLLVAGRDLGIDKYHSALMTSKEVTMNPEDMKDGETLYDHSENRVSSLWSKVARKEEKAVRKLVKAIKLA
jgi:hypothetical protein